MNASGMKFRSRSGAARSSRIRSRRNTLPAGPRRQLARVFPGGEPEIPPGADHEPFGGIVVAQQGTPGRLDAQGQLGAAGAGHRRQLLERAGRDVGVPAARARLDELGERPLGGAELQRVGGCLPGRGQGALIPAQAIAQHGTGGMHPGHDNALAKVCRGVQHVLDQLLGLLLLALHGGQPGLGGERRRVLTAGHLGDPVALRDQGRACGQVAAVDIEDGASDERDRKQAEGAGLADDIQMTLGQDVPVHVVPQVGSKYGRDRDAAEGLVPGEVVAAERLYGPVQLGCRCRVPVGIRHRHHLKQQVGLAWRPRRGRLPHGPRHLAHAGARASAWTRAGGQAPGDPAKAAQPS